jgi:coenzyme F420-0:L-glutamate ligase/coenzyme F420-1:gamma-L-glutamate ligase
MAEAVRAALGVEPGTVQASEIGIPFIDPEERGTRARRALRIALLTCPDVVGEVDGDTVALVAPDDFTLGVAAARAEVALRGEGLASIVTRTPVSSLPVDAPLASHPGVLIAFH